uniref:Uncharacterized protein n=1 Tax=Anopheles arabiensis TaxID=7173 RepID=A0A182IGE3_ANOAR
MSSSGSCGQYIHSLQSNIPSDSANVATERAKSSKH